MSQVTIDDIKDSALLESFDNDRYVSIDNQSTLKAISIETPLGLMIAIADEKVLYLLEFQDRKDLLSEIKNLKSETQSRLIFGINEPLDLIQQELEQYFKGELKSFKTPIKILGSQFKKDVWEKLLKIPFGKTYSYSDIAKLINQPKAYRAVARANGSNQLAIIIPCHRVINIDKTLGGYSAGIKKKQWLLNHELKNARL